jgi:uncharacterized protein
VVWSALNDPEVLRHCIPGCESIEKTDATHFNASAILKIGPVKATFKANLALSDLDPPHRCTLKGEGQGGVAGFARGEAEVVLTPEADGTVLTYKAQAAIGGKLAQIGQRLIDGAAKQIADDFFKRFSTAIATGLQTSGAQPPEEESHAVAAAVEAEPQKREGLAPEIWVVGLIALIVILLLIFGVVLGK